MLFIVFYSCIGFIPNLEAIDKIAPQWLFMGVLNFIVGLYIIKNISVYTSQFKGYWNSWLIRLYIFFIIWGSLSFFYAINPTEVLVNDAAFGSCKATDPAATHLLAYLGDGACSLRWAIRQVGR